jgi:membrane protein DedA with SNARE-associated domain
VIEWATELIESIGLVGVALLVALESIFPPIPSEVVLLLSGFNVNVGRFGLVPAVLAATLGSVAGAWVLYGLGAWVSEERLEAFLGTVGKVIGLTRRDVEKGFDWFERRGPWVIFFGRLIPVVRSVVSIPAGSDHMNPVRFTLLTAAGSLLWNTIWIVVGNSLGDQWERAGEWSDWVERVVMVVGVVVVIVLVVRARRARRHEAEEPAPHRPLHTTTHEAGTGAPGAAEATAGPEPTARPDR